MARAGNAADDAKSLNASFDAVANSSTKRAIFNRISPVLGPERAAAVVNSVNQTAILQGLMNLNVVLALVETGCSLATAYFQFKMAEMKYMMADTNENKTLIQGTSDLIDMVIDKESAYLSTQMAVMSQTIGNAKTILSRQQQHMTHYMG